MVYGGKPSTGCQTCRSRHIKCDEARPHCRACVKTGRSCPGYKDPFDVMLRGQKAFPRRNPGKRAEPKKSSPVSSSACPSSRGSNEVGKIPHLNQIIHAGTLARLPSPRIPPALYLPTEDVVAPLFFNTYLHLPKDPQILDGFLELLPQAYSRTERGSHLQLATLAVSFFSVAAWTGQRSLLRLSEQFFLNALPKTRKMLQHGVARNMDEILMTVLLLYKYEEFYAFKDQGAPSQTHIRGAVALINSGKLGTSGSPSQTMAYAVQNQIIRNSLGLACPVVQSPDLRPLSSAPMAPTAPSHLIVAASQLVSLRLEWGRLTSNRTPDMTEITDILGRANDLDIQLSAWANCMPSHWTPVPATSIPQTVREAGLFHRCDCYPNIRIASTWNLYRDTRISVLNVILNCLRVLGDNVKTQSTLLTIQSLATDICASVPFFLGSQTRPVQFDFSLVEYPEAEQQKVTAAHRETAPLLSGWYVMSYLSHICSPGLGLSDEQMGWIRGQMRRVLQIYGYG